MVRTTNNHRLRVLACTVAAASILITTYITFFGANQTAQTEAPTTSTPTISEGQSSENSHSAATIRSDPSSNEDTASEPSNKRYYAALNPSEPVFKTASGESFPLRTYKPLSVNDPNGQQWWTSSTGLETAWNIGSGPRQTTVAVIDTGFALQHEEFTNRWAINEAEQGPTENEAPSQLNCTDRGLPLNESCNLIDDDFNGIVDDESGIATLENPSRRNCTDQNFTLDKSCNLIDDDSNNFIDDVIGWDFANFDASVQAGQTNPNGDGVQHGTAVAGVLAANGNNSKGIAGVDWNTKILPLQAIDDDSYGNTLTVSRAIYYAADRGVDVINLSLGAVAEDSYMRQAIHYALARNVIVVAASGNDGCECISYPAKYPEVVTVGAESQYGGPAYFSSYGAELDVLAPGEGMITPSWSQAFPETEYASGMAGTSFSTPYVSGLLSLARSHQPNATWGELVNNLLATANHSTLTAANPFSSTLGSGYAKAGAYLTRVTTTAAPIIQYFFEPTPIKSTLSSALSYQCMSANDFPTAPLYDVTSGSSTFYTIDALERLRAITRGDTVAYVGRACVGLPTDQPGSIRNINLLSEIKNRSSSKLGW